MKTILFLLAGLALAAPAHASNVATPKMVEVASWAAGRPIAVHCESDPAEWSRLTTAHGFVSTADGFTMFAAPIVYLAPARCADMASRGVLLGLGLNVLLHEAAHQRGFRDEDLAECAARVLIYSALHNFYEVPWFSPRMRVTVDAALAFSRGKPAAYQNGCSRL